MRIASLAPSNTEILHALGLIDQIVAVDNYSDYPPSGLETAVRLGTDLQIDMEKLIAAKPDLVLASLSVPGMERVTQDLEERGLTHVTLNPSSLEGLYEDIATAAAATDTIVRGRALIASLRERVLTANDRVQKREWTPNVYWEWWPNPYIGPGADNWLSEVSRLAGARNIGEDFEGSRFTSTHGEEIVLRAPDVIAAVWCGIPAKSVKLERIFTRKGWETVPALKNKRVYALEEGLYCRPSPRLVDGLEQLIEILHGKW